MPVRTVYHLNIDSDQIEGATVALLPGDPGRVEALALTPPFERGRELANKREYRTWIAYLGHTPVLVTSTGIGGPSASIAIDELAQLGVRTFLRVGTTGAIQADIDIGTVIVTTGAVRLDGASTHYAPIEYPAVAHPDVVQAAAEAAGSSVCRSGPGSARRRTRSIRARSGTTRTRDTCRAGSRASRKSGAASTC